MPITNWKPISKAQEQFLALPNTIKEGFFGGSAGPGKSEILMMYPIAREWYKHPRFKALFTRRSYKELKKEIIPRSRELYTAFGGRFNKSDLVWDFEDVGGGYIYMGHIEHEDNVHDYDSMEINLWLPDEVQSISEWMYLYIGFTRVRTSYPELPAIIRAAGMPGNIGHTWVKNRFIKPAPLGGVKIVGKAGNKRIFIFSTLADNPKVNEEYSRGLEVLPEAEKRAKKYGDWNSYEGQVFEEFRDRHYETEPDNALHVIPKFEIPVWWPRIVVIDWGFAAWNYVTFTAISPNRRCYIYREMAWKQTKIEEWAPYVKELCEKEEVKTIKVCKSASQDRGQEHTIQQQIEAALGQPVELTAASGHGSRIAGKALLHEYLRWKSKYVPLNEKEAYSEETALFVLRNHGERAYKDYQGRFATPESENNLPKLQIFKESPENRPITLLPEAIKACTYNKNSDGTSAEDVAVFDGDDPYDNIRYVVDAVDRYFNEAQSEYQSVQLRQKLVEDFERTKDWNQLFRQAKAIEHLEDTIYIPARRYAH